LFWDKNLKRKMRDDEAQVKEGSKKYMLLGWIPHKALKVLDRVRKYIKGNVDRQGIQCKS